MIENVQKRLLFLSLDRWPSCCRLPKAAHEAGFEVFTCGMSDDPLHISRFVKKRFVISPQAKKPAALFACIIESIVKSKADLIIPVDERSIRVIPALYDALKSAKTGPEKAVFDVIGFSRGHQDFFGHVFSKKLTADLAQKNSIRVPEQIQCQDVRDAQTFATKHGYPLVLKAEHGSAGTSVEMCHNNEDVLNFFSALSSKHSHLIAQKFIEGVPAMINGAVLKGKVLTSISFLKVECFPEPKGPSSVVEILENAEMKKGLQIFAEATGYSGIISLDFMLDKKGKTYLLECNPRPTPVSHLGSVIGVDVFKALYDGLTGKSYKPDKPKVQKIALFPKELNRNPQSPHLLDGYHDVPWEQPDLLEFFTKTLFQRPKSG